MVTCERQKGLYAFPHVEKRLNSAVAHPTSTHPTSNLSSCGNAPAMMTEARQNDGDNNPDLLLQRQC